MKNTYYQDQLNKLIDSDYPMSVKLYDGQGNQTNQIDINLKSIPELLKFLQNQKGFCCLGVACKIFSPKHLKRIDGTLAGGHPLVEYNDPKWLSEINQHFQIKTNNFTLSSLNDDQNFTFNEIADLLEAVYVYKVLDDQDV